MTDLIRQLREHDDARLYHEADALMTAAADRIAELEKDAARYRWLRDPKNLRGEVWMCAESLCDSKLDRAIDAEMQDAPQMRD